uniref:SGE1 protein n=1 Tax=Ganoderma boninense TaxID=34458 RepID=A0A5K1K552_9APHY|nr:SGE1 protein [Ganoderma boninense]
MSTDVILYHTKVTQVKLTKMTPTCKLRPAYATSIHHSPSEHAAPQLLPQPPRAGPAAQTPSPRPTSGTPTSHARPRPAPGTTLTLIDQSPDGGPLSSELQDAQQGGDAWAREDFAHAAQRDFDARSPYGRHPGPESAEENSTGTGTGTE